MAAEDMVTHSGQSTLEEFLLANGPLDDWGNLSDEEIDDVPEARCFCRGPTPSFGYGYNGDDRPDPLLMCSEMEIRLDSKSEKLELDGFDYDCIFQQLQRLPRNRGSACSSREARAQPSSSSSSTSP